MDLKQEFEQASLNAKGLPAQSNDVLLQLYSLFKQATEGDVNIEKPTNFFDFAGIAKFNAWEELKGLNKEEAMQKYIDLVKSLGGAA
jgi:diazepam-binding inhibitor (GABA receptor modulator, acyl-CoA-binding protein)